VLAAVRNRGLARLLVTSSLAVPAAAQRPAARPAPRPADHWSVDTARSEMTDEPSATLYLKSTNSVQGVLLDTRAVLFIRCREHTLELFINTGSVLDGDAGENTTVRVRWGTDAPEEQTWSRSTDFEAAFAPDPAAFIRQLVAMPDMRFEFHPFDATPRVAIFDARGLQPHLPLVAAACPSVLEQRQPNDSEVRPSALLDPMYTAAIVEEQPELLSAPRVEYPQLLRQAGIQGRVVVQFVLDTLGRAEPQSLKVLATPNPGFNPSALDYVQRAVRVLMQIPVEFKLTSK
jgi:TonB family protein